MKRLFLLSQRERGQGLVEYVLLLVMVALVVMVVLLLFGPAVGNLYSDIVANMVYQTPDSAAGTEQPTSITGTTEPTSQATNGLENTTTPSVSEQPGSSTTPSTTVTTDAAPNPTAPPPTATFVATAIPPTALSATATSIAGSILSVSAQRTGGGNGNTLDVTVTVSAATTLTLVDSQGSTRVNGVACNLTCVVHLPNIGKYAGYVAVSSADGSVATVWYPAKKG